MIGKNLEIHVSKCAICFMILFVTQSVKKTTTKKLAKQTNDVLSEYILFKDICEPTTLSGSTKMNDSEQFYDDHEVYAFVIPLFCL